MTLAQLLAYGDVHAPAVRVAQTRVALGDAEVRAASPLLPADPQLTLKLGPRLTASGSAIDAQVILLQRLQIAGERGLRIDAAKRTRRRLRAGLSQVRWTVHQQLHAGYRRAQVARGRLQAAKRLLAFTERLLHISRRREQAGAISGLQVQVVRGDLAQAQQAKIAADNAYLAARLRLAQLSGWPVRHLLEPDGRVAAPTAAVPSARSLLHKAMRSHPALRLTHASIVESEARLRLAKREVAPKPALGVQLNREGQAAARASHIVMGVLSLPIPMWQRNQGAVARARARVAVARAEHRALRRQLHARIARAVAAVRAGAKRIRIYGTKVLPTFGTSLRMLQRAFEAGKIDVLQVMVARGRFLEIQRQALNAYDDYYRAVATLEAVVGSDDWTHAGPRGAR
ncbi:MAG: TolC family protein [Myxococcales bacterium]|nr:TolC family protein [Myxococcales bacterium]